MHYYELHSDGALAGKFVVGFDPPRGGTVIAGWHDTVEEAAAQVSYLNGGLPPGVVDIIGLLHLKFDPDNAIDPRAYLPRCVHGRRQTEPCPECDKAL